MLTTQTQTQTNTLASTLISALFVAALGASILFAAGLSHSATLHDAAHDVRHATGFPCH